MKVKLIGGPRDGEVHNYYGGACFTCKEQIARKPLSCNPDNPIAFIDEQGFAVEPRTRLWRTLLYKIEGLDENGMNVVAVYHGCEDDPLTTPYDAPGEWKYK